MAAKGKEVIKKAFGSPLTMFASLGPGSDGPVCALVSRRWDAYSVYNKFLSTDFLFSDEEGTVMHGTAKSNIAHIFVDKLQEGSLYYLKSFTVLANPTKWRIMKDSEYIIQLQGATIVRKAPGPLDGYVRHPFQLVALDALEPTGNTHFVDVLGSVGAVSSPVTRSNGRQTIDFKICDDRGNQVRVTLWGKLGDRMVLKKETHGESYSVILTSMTAKIYNAAITLVSSSATLIVDDTGIPEIAAFTGTTRGRNLELESKAVVRHQHIATNLAELLKHGRRDQKQASCLFTGEVEITNVLTKNGWYNLSCSTPKCRKGVRIDDGAFRCDSCEIKVRFPRPRFRLQVAIRDASATLIAVLFDEPAEQLLHRTVGVLIDEHDHDDSEDATALPRLVQELIGTSHVFHMRALTYYHYGEYESFNYDKVIVPSVDEPGQTMSPKGNQDSTPNTGSSGTENSGKSVVVMTPAKASEAYKRAEESNAAAQLKGRNKRLQTQKGGRLKKTQVSDTLAESHASEDPKSPADSAYEDDPNDPLSDFEASDSAQPAGRTNRQLVMSDSDDGGNE